MGYSKTSLFECFGIFQDFSFSIFFFFSERSYQNSSNNALRRFLSFSWLLHSLSVFFASVCNDRQLIMVGNPFLSFFGRQFARQFNRQFARQFARQFNLTNPFGHKYHWPWQKNWKSPILGILVPMSECAKWNLPRLRLFAQLYFFHQLHWAKTIFHICIPLLSQLTPAIVWRNKK